MPNIASALKEEIARVARKVAKPESDALRKLVTQQRSALAVLKRRTDALERVLARIGKSGRGTAQVTSDDVSGESQSERLRFSAKGFAKQRERLGISAAAVAQLLGVSGLSVYKWESGKTRPRPKQIEKIASLRGLGKREVAERLTQLGGAENAGASNESAGGARAKAAPTVAKKTSPKKSAGKKSTRSNPAAKLPRPKAAASAKSPAKKARAKPAADKGAASGTGAKKTPVKRVSKKANA